MGSILRPLAIFLGAGFLLACGPVAVNQQGETFDASRLDAIDAAMERLADDRWRSWTMELVDGALAFRVDVADAPPRGACAEIAGAIASGGGQEVDWTAELLRRGSVVERCRA